MEETPTRIPIAVLAVVIVIVSTEPIAASSCNLNMEWRHSGEQIDNQGRNDYDFLRVDYSSFNEVTVGQPINGDLSANIPFWVYQGLKYHLQSCCQKH